MSGVRLALPSAETTGDTRPFPEDSGRGPPKDGVEDDTVNRFEGSTGGENSSFAWETVTTMDMDTMRSILQGDSPWRGIERVTTKELALVIMDLLQSEIDRISLQPEDDDSQYRRKCVKCLRGLGEHYKIVPSLLYIGKSIVVDVEDQGYGGGFSDICIAKLTDCLDPVCVKRLRIHKNGSYCRKNVQKAFCREALIWRQLRHENIVRLIGVIDDISFCLISPWMKHGDIHDYLREHPRHDRRGWVWDVAAGLSYLHACILHRDIRGANILVGSDLRCLITDFGISIVVETQMLGSTIRDGGTVGAQPPQILDHPEYDGIFSWEVDIYSFGRTIIEMYTGESPHSILPTGALGVAGMVPKIPDQPVDDILPAILWRKIVLSCLAPEPRERPSADKILDALLELYETYFKEYRLSHKGPLATVPQPAGEDTWKTDDVMEIGTVVDAVPMRVSTASGPVDQDWAEINLWDANALANLMTRDAPWRGIEWVREEVAPVVMDRLQSEVDEISPHDLESRKKYVKCLLRLGRKYDILPSQLYISKNALKDREQDSCLGGAFSDVFRGEIHGHPGFVCLKRLRHTTRPKRQQQLKGMKKRLCREALSWRQVSHENILPFYGVSNDMFGDDGLCFISPWMENGTVLDYLEKYPDHDRRGWVWDVAAGLNYLHQLDPCIVHKDIRGANLLVGDDLRCYLVDFGISIVAESLKPGTRTHRAGNICWLPPEVMNDSCKADDKPLCKVDIYSLGCTIVEMYANKPPYADLAHDAKRVKEILKMKLPPQPSADLLPSRLWDKVVVKALSPLPEDRPSAAEIKAALEAMYPEYLEKYRKESRTKPLKSVLHWRTATLTA